MRNLRPDATSITKDSSAHIVTMIAAEESLNSEVMTMASTRGGSKTRLGKYLYMVIDRNYYELPLFVGTLAEVAEFCNTDPNNINTAIHNAKKRGNQTIYAKIKLSKKDQRELRLELEQLKERK